MDRTAWVAVILATMGLVGWYAYVAKQSQPARPAEMSAPAAASTSTVVASPSVAPVAPDSTGTPAPAPTPAAPSFALKTETLGNGDVELHFTNRGGGISEASFVIVFLSL